MPPAYVLPPGKYSAPKLTSPARPRPEMLVLVATSPSNHSPVDMVPLSLATLESLWTTSVSIIRLSSTGATTGVSGMSSSSGSMIACLIERSAAASTKPSMNSGPAIVLTTCDWIGKVFSGCTGTGGCGSAALTVTVCGIHQFVAVNVNVSGLVVV